MATITHLVPLDTPLWLAMVTAQRLGLKLLTNGQRCILSAEIPRGFSRIYAGVKQ